jgi:hypothetical protein
MTKVKDVLFDFYQATEDNTIRRLLGDIWECEVENETEANMLVNMRLDTLSLWLQGFKRK